MGISDRLTAIRKSLGLNQIPFAKKIGASQSAYANYERGATVIPLTLAAEICRDYSISADWLLLGKGTMKTSDLNRFVESAVIATRIFITDKNLTITPEKEAKLVSFLLEDLMSGNDINEERITRIVEMAS